MNRLDDDLRSALQRRDVAPAFTERVMARIAAQQPPPSLWQRFRLLLQFPAMRVAAAGVTAVLIIGLSLGIPRYLEYQRELEEEGRIARAQVMLAFQIASSKLNKAKRKISEVTERRADQAEETDATEKESAPADRSAER